MKKIFRLAAAIAAAATGLAAPVQAQPQGSMTVYLFCYSYFDAVPTNRGDWYLYVTPSAPVTISYADNAKMNTTDRATPLWLAWMKAQKVPMVDSKTNCSISNQSKEKADKMRADIISSRYAHFKLREVDYTPKI